MGRLEGVSRLPLSLCCHRYKYLLHLDGQSCSSRLEQLLVLNSLVLKEESGYVAFYHHLLKEYKHYLPVWRQGQGPEDVLDAVRWAREHDEAAQQVAQNAQQVVMGRGKGRSGGAEGPSGKWSRTRNRCLLGTGARNGEKRRQGAGGLAGEGGRLQGSTPVGEKELLIAKRMLAGKGWGQAEARIIRHRHTLTRIESTLDCWRQCMMPL